MPPPHSFWVILIGKTPTSFRAKEREDLVPTLRQLQRTQTDVTLRWFEGGKVWESPEAALGAAKLAATEAREKRTREWRPGGEHRDPKARFELTRDQKRAKFKRDRSGPDLPGNDDRPQSPFGPKAPREPRPVRPERPRPDRPWSDRSKPVGRPDRPWSDRPPTTRPGPRGGKPDRPRFDRPRDDGARSPFPNRGPRPPRIEDRERPPRRDRPSGPALENPFKDRTRPDRPADRPDRRPDVRPNGRTDRRPSPGRPARPSGPPSDRGGFKPPKRRN